MAEHNSMGQDDCENCKILRKYKFKPSENQIKLYHDYNVYAQAERDNIVYELEKKNEKI